MRFYVYDLIDPRDKSVFYVGKGQRDRVAAHESEAKAGRVSRKHDRIRDIWASGYEVERKIVARFDDEYEAYSHEAERIAEIGLANLTNLVAGNNGGRSGPEGWNLAFLKRAAPILARALLWTHKNSKAMLFGVDISDAMNEWIDQAIGNCGLEAVAKAVLPFGIELVGREAS